MARRGETRRTESARPETDEIAVALASHKSPYRNSCIVKLTGKVASNQVTKENEGRVSAALDNVNLRLSDFDAR